MGDTVRVFITVTLLVGSVVALIFSRRNRVHLHTASLILFWLIVLEAMLAQARDTLTIAGQQVEFLGYVQFACWLFLGVVFLLRGESNRGTVKELFGPTLRWAFLFALVCIVSIIYTPRPYYALAWAYKLILVLCILGVLNRWIVSWRDTFTVFRYLVFAFLVVTTLPLSLLMIEPAAFWTEQRGGGIFGSISSSEAAAVLFILTLALSDGTGQKKYNWIFPIALFMMLIAGGKAAIAACFVSVIVYLLSTGRAMLRRFVLFTGFIGLFFLFIFRIDLPLTLYLESYFMTGDQLENLTGRIQLWELASGFILDNWFWGHGYLSSRVSFLPTAYWTPISMHNSFVEVLYNNGFLGLTVLLLIHVMILRNLRRIAQIRKRLPRQISFIYAALLALYVNSILNGMVSVYFGAHATKGFIIFLVILMMSNRVIALSQRLPGIIGPDFGSQMIRNLTKMAPTIAHLQRSSAST